MEPNYILGYEALDTDHKTIIGMLYDLLESIGSEEKLRELQITFLRHFDFEEDLMRRVDFPGVDMHVVSHQIVRHHIEHAVRSYTKEKIECIIADFLTHVDVFDRELVRYLKEFDEAT